MLDRLVPAQNWSRRSKHKSVWMNDEKMQNDHAYVDWWYVRASTVCMHLSVLSRHIFPLSETRPIFSLWKGHHIFPISHLKWVVQMTWANFSFAGMISLNEHLFIWSGYYTLELEDTPATGLLTARFPRLICTEMLAWDKSTPELWRAWVNELSNLLQIKEKNMYQHTFIFGKDNKSLIAHA